MKFWKCMVPFKDITHETEINKKKILLSLHPCFDFIFSIVASWADIFMFHHIAIALYVSHSYSEFTAFSLMIPHFNIPKPAWYSWYPQ